LIKPVHEKQEILPAMNQINQLIRITPAIERAFAWDGQASDYESKDKPQRLILGMLRLAVISFLIFAALAIGA
jgi:hypothetical protein